MPADAVGRARARMLSRLVDLRVEAAMRALFPRVAELVAEDFAVADSGFALVAGLADPVGPFAVGAVPSLPDCGAAVAFIWRDALGAGAARTPRIDAWRAALDAHPAFAAVLDPYRPMVAAWAQARRG